MHLGRRTVLFGLATTVGLIIGCVPDVHQNVTGTTQIWMTSADRSLYRVDISLYAINGQSTDGARSHLLIDVARCPSSTTCVTPTQYISYLSPSSYDATDLKNISAKHAAFGGPITVSFVGAGPADQVDRSPGTSPDSASMSSTWGAVAKVTIFGVSCEDKAAQAGRHTTAYTGGYNAPHNRKDAPLKATSGVPSRPRCAAAAGRR